MIPYRRETVEYFTYRTKCRIGDIFYSYFPLIPRRLFLCKICTIEISNDDIVYWYTVKAVDDPTYTSCTTHSVSDDRFDSVLFATPEAALEALKISLKESLSACREKYKVDEKTGHWIQIWDVNN